MKYVMSVLLGTMVIGTPLTSMEKKESSTTNQWKLDKEKLRKTIVLWIHIVYTEGKFCYPNSFDHAGQHNPRLAQELNSIHKDILGLSREELEQSLQQFTHRWALEAIEIPKKSK
jgi:hypothetical protein